MIVFTIRRQIVLIWGKNIKNSLEAYVYLTPSIMLLHHFPQKWKFKVFSLAQSQMWEVQRKADKVNTSLFSFHAYLYRNSLLQNRSFFPSPLLLNEAKNTVNGFSGTTAGRVGGLISLCANVLFHYSPRLSKAALLQAHVFLVPCVTRSFANTIEASLHTVDTLTYAIFDCHEFMPLGTHWEISKTPSRTRAFVDNEDEIRGRKKETRESAIEGKAKHHQWWLWTPGGDRSSGKTWSYFS